MEFIRKKNAIGYFTFPMVDSATPASLKTGLSPADTAYYKDTSGAWTSLAITDTASEIGSTGMYEIDLSATEMNHDQITIKFTAAGAQDQVLIICTIPQTSDMTQILGTAVSTPATAGVLDVNVKNIANAVVNTATAQIGANVVSMAAGTITAAAVATGAIDADAIADGAIDAGAIATGAITNAKFAAGAIDAAAIATGAIDADAIAADAIGASEFAQAAADKVWSTAARALTDKTGFGVSSLAGDTITAASIAADAGTEIAAAIWNALTSGMSTVGSIGKKLADWVVGTITANQAVNVTQIDGVALAAHVSGEMPADMLAVNGGATNGYNATLKLKQLSIANNGGTALELTAAGGNGHGISAAGFGIGNGIYAIGGSTGGDGIKAVGMASGSGTRCAGGATGDGLYCVGGATSGHGIHTGAALEGDGIRAVGYGTGSGLRLQGGASTGDGITAIGGAGGCGGVFAGTGGGDGLSCYGEGVGSGLAATGGDSDGNGMLLTKGAGVGYDLRGATPSHNFPMLQTDQIAAIVDDVWGALTSGMTAVGSIGKKLADLVLGTDNKVILSENLVNQTFLTNTTILGMITQGYTTTRAPYLDVLNGIIAAINAEVDTCLADIKLDHLIAVAESGDVADSSIIAKLASSAATPDFSSYDNTTDSLQALADSGGGGLTAQQVRNAMCLAQTYGDPDEDSVDDFLQDIKVQTDKMNFTGDNIDANIEAIDTNANAAAKLAATADTESLCAVDTSRPFVPTTTEFETDTVVLAKDRWVIFRSGTLIGQAKPITACEPIGGKSHITTEAFTAAPSNGDTFAIV